MSRYLNRNEIEVTMNDENLRFTVNARVPTLFRVLLVLLILFIMAVTCRLAMAAEVTLMWDANQPTPDGYQLYQRIEGQQYDYSRPAWEGSNTTCVIDNLDPGIQYYFVVRAYVGDNQSGDSNEVNFTGAIPAPVNLRINMEISVLIDVNGVPYIAMQQINEKGVAPMH